VPKIHYVYQLIDPRDAQVFYVGKGQGARAWKHEKRVRAGDTVGDNIKKVARIQEVIGSGFRVLVAIVGRFDKEREALALEAALIGQLPNLTNGGTMCLSPAERAQAIAHRKALVELARKQSKKRLLKSFGVADNDAAAQFVDQLSGDWKKTIAAPKPPSRYFAPRWIRKGRGVIVTDGDHAGRAGIVTRVTHTEAVLEMAGGAMVECPIAWLKRTPS
jgi:hypothetical protein